MSPMSTELTEMKTHARLACGLALFIFASGCRTFPDPYKVKYGKPVPPPEVLMQPQYDRPKVDWAKAKKTVFCSIMLAYGLEDGPSGDYRGWAAAGCHPEKITDPQTGRRDMPMLYQPLAGIYDQKDPETIKRHLDMSDRMGIDAWAVWYWPPLDKGSQTHRDNMKLYMDYIEKHNRRVKMCAVIDMAFIPIGVDLKLYRDWDADFVVHHIEYMLENFAKRPSYFTYEGRPVVFIYGTWIFRDHKKTLEWDYVLRKVRYDGYDPIFIVEVGPETAPEVCPGGQSQFGSLGVYYRRLMSQVFDGGFNVCLPGEGGLKGFDRGKVWKAGVDFCNSNNAIYLPNPSAGYRTYLWVKPPDTIFEVAREDGRHFSDTWQKAVDSGARWIFLHTWNEWYENTQLEPAIEYGYLYVDLSRDWIRKFKGNSGDLFDE